jgi:hypothetical protein
MLTARRMEELEEFDEALRARDQKVKRRTLLAVAEAIYEGIAVSQNPNPEAKAALLALARGLKSDAAKLDA